VPQTVRNVRPEELPAWFAAFGSAFYMWLFEPHALAAIRREQFEIDRVVGAFEDDGTVVGTFRTFGSELTLPGGTRVPVNAVSGVSVLPTHRRRGTLTRLVADDLERAVARGDAASVLISAEWPIYGRFGYGPATWHAKWTVRTRAARLEIEPVGSIEFLDALAARQVLRPVRPVRGDPTRRTVAPGLPLGRRAGDHRGPGSTPLARLDRAPPQRLG
jgi:predicted N-acetyltransferase YhbS